MTTNRAWLGGWLGFGPRTADPPGTAEDRKWAGRPSRKGTEPGAGGLNRTRSSDTDQSESEIEAARRVLRPAGRIRVTSAAGIRGVPENAVLWQIQISSDPTGDAGDDAGKVSIQRIEWFGPMKRLHDDLVNVRRIVVGADGKETAIDGNVVANLHGLYGYKASDAAPTKPAPETAEGGDGDGAAGGDGAANREADAGDAAGEGAKDDHAPDEVMYVSVLITVDEARYVTRFDIVNDVSEDLDLAKFINDQIGRVYHPAGPRQDLSW